MKEKKQLWTKEFILALIITFGTILSCNLLLSTISIYAKEITMVDSYAGLMTGAFTLASLFIRIFAGNLLDKIGRKKILLLGSVITAIATISYSFTDQIYLIIALRALQGIGFGIASTAIATIVTDVTPEERLLEGIGYSGVCITLTTAIGPSIALKIVGEDYSRFNSLFIFTFIIAVITLILSILLKQDSNKTKVEDNTTDIQTNENDNWKKRIFIPSLILFFAAIAESAILSFTALYGIELGFNNIGLFFAINALGILISRLFINQIVNKLGMDKVVLLGLFIFAISLIGMAVIHTSLMLNIFGFLCGVMMGSLLPIINVMIINEVSLNMRGTANAIYYSLIDAGYGIGSIMWGAVIGLLGFRSIYFLSGILLIIGFIIFIVYSKQKNNTVKTSN